jgi:TPR repeat protein
MKFARCVFLLLLVTLWLVVAGQDRGLGNIDSMDSLGHCYETGSGVKQDLVEAKRWYKKAAELGDEDAKAALKRLGGQ